jgi:hypothetical protein
MGIDAARLSIDVSVEGGSALPPYLLLIKEKTELG